VEGKSIRDIRFRSRYNAVVLAVHREGVRVHARVGDVVLHPGDVLLLDAVGTALPSSSLYARTVPVYPYTLAASFSLPSHGK
jgi:Trk K+ transport system NAD-binding subunit